MYNSAHNNTIGSASDANLFNLIMYNGWSGIVVVDSPLGSNILGNNFIYNHWLLRRSTSITAFKIRW